MKGLAEDGPVSETLNRILKGKSKKVIDSIGTVSKSFTAQTAFANKREAIYFERIFTEQ